MSSKPLKITFGPSRVDAYKCYLAASFLDKSLAAVPVEALGEPVFSFPTALAGDSVLSSANAITRYLFFSSDTPTQDEKKREEWLALEDNLLKPFIDDLSFTTVQSALEKLESGIADGAFDTNLTEKGFAPQLETISIVATILASFDSNLRNISHVQKNFPKIFQFISDFKAENSKKIDFSITKANALIDNLYPMMAAEAYPVLHSGFPLVLSLNRFFNTATLDCFPFLGSNANFSLEEGKIVAAPKGKKVKIPVAEETISPELQFSASLKIFGLLKSLKDENLKKIYSTFARNPKEIATHLVAKLEQNEFLMKHIVESFEVAGPGFINIHVKPEYAKNYISELLTVGQIEPDFQALTDAYKASHMNSPSQYLHKQTHTVAIDMSAPNVAKEMHVGHLRSTIIGEVLGRILAHKGHVLRKINHIGDWGTQFGMLLTFIEDGNLVVEPGKTSLTELNVLYKSAKTRFDEDEDFKRRSRAKVVDLQSGKPKETEMWKKLIQISESGFDEIYQRLDVDFPDGHCGESFYQSRIPKMIEELQQKKLIEDFDGAKIVTTSIQKVPLFIQKSDGGFGYDSTDMTALKYRLQELKCDRILYVVGEQGNHFYSCFEVAEKLGWLKRFKGHQNVGPTFVGFGMILGSDGKRFRSRSGESVTLRSLLDEAKKRIQENLEERVKNNETPLKIEEIDEAAAKIGYSALKYFDLKNSREKDYVFDYDLMLQHTGNTGVYIIYTYARLCSIERKLQSVLGLNVDQLVSSKASSGSIEISKLRKKEWEIFKAIVKYGDVMSQVEETLSPHYLCTYVYDVCVAVAKFYTEHQLLINDSSSSSGKSLDKEHGEDWVCLLRAAKIVIKETAPLLGIDLLEKI